MTADEFYAYFNYGHEPENKSKPRSRYGAVGVRDADNVYFHSGDELTRWHELQLLEKAGEIFHLERQIRYDLHATTPDGERVRVAGYKPDFRYVELSGELIIEDFKSPASAKDEAYRLRKRMFEAEYGLQVRETMRTRR